MNRLVLTLLLASPSLSALALDLNVSELGLPPNSEKNATPIVRKALEKINQSGGGTLSFPKGTYHFHAEGCRVSKNGSDGPYVSNNQDDFPKWTAMPMRNMKNVTIDGAGSLFLMHHRMMVFHIGQSENITLKNLAFDFVTPIHTDSTLTAIDAKTFTLQFAPGTTYHIDQKGVFRFLIDGDLKSDWSSYVFEAATGRTKYKKHNFSVKLGKAKATEIKPGLVQFQGKVGEPFGIGDRITLRHNNRNHVGIFIEESKNTTLDHVTIHHACGMGVVGQRSENITLTHFRMTPRKGAGRISTAMADATHFSGCRGLIKVVDSHFQGMMDDAINIHGTSLRITQIDDKNNSIVARFIHGQSKGFTIASPGDEIRLIDNQSLLPVGTGFYKVKSVSPIDVNQVAITFESPLPKELKIKHAIENITYTPEVIFSGNTVKNNRARGMLFNTPRKCLVENNLIRTSGSAVLVAGDANGWFESGAVGAFGPTIIRNNTFDNCLTNMFQFCNAIISIDPVIKTNHPDHSYHKDIRIENNHFKVFDAPLVFARSVDGLMITGNTFERTNTFKPWHPNHAAILLESCQNITIKDNQVKGTLLSTEMKLRGTDPNQVSVAPQSPFQFPSEN